MSAMRNLLLPSQSRDMVNRALDQRQRLCTLSTRAEAFRMGVTVVELAAGC
jgi:hypothetical protein